MKDNILIVRLSSGEEIIAKVNEGENSVELRQPLLMIPMEEGRLTFASWLPYNDNPAVEVSKSAVVFAIVPVKQMVDNYKQAVGDPVIATPDQKIIV